MTTIPTLTTERLLLRPFTLEDAPTVRALASAREIAEMTTIPHPYEEGMAEEWICTHQGAYERGELVTWAITRREDGMVLGAISLSINKANLFAELGYWVGKPYWGQGYCTEAAREALRYGFEVLNLNRIQARHMTKNPASGRVMQKIGMTYEGTLRQSVYRWEKFEDMVIYAILREEYLSRAPSAVFSEEERT